MPASFARIIASRRSAHLAVLIAGVALASCSTHYEAPPQPVAAVVAPPAVNWPTHGWRTSTPEEQGIDSNVLANAMDAIRARHIPVHSLLIERHGVIVLDAYFHPFADNQLHEVASVTKSVVSTLVGIAIAKNELGDLNAPVVSLLPDVAPQADDPRKARITLAHMLSMTSGLDCSSQGGRNFLQQMEHSEHWTNFALARRETADPGSTFGYCAGNMEVVSAVLTRRTGASASDFAQRELFSPLGIEQTVWPTDRDGVSHGFADLKLQPRDMAKLGYLWLHNGEWEGRQIVPASYVQAELSPHATVQPDVQYGYGMWIYPNRGHAGGPADFEANGNGGQRIAVVPSQDVVEVTTGDGLDANDVVALISAAVKSDASLPPNPEALARLQAHVQEAALGTGYRVAALGAKATVRARHPKPVLRTASLGST
jgi:CubicO group peptidase (beta-lactamase class C family)